MNWAHYAILDLQAGKQTELTPRGHSMTGKVNDGDTVILDPVKFMKCPECDNGLVGKRHESPADCDKCNVCNGKAKIAQLDVDDIVLVKVKGNVYLHLILATKGYGDSIKYQIGNNKGGINGWVSASAVYGKAIKVMTKRGRNDGN